MRQKQLQAATMLASCVPSNDGIGRRCVRAEATLPSEFCLHPPNQKVACPRYRHDPPIQRLSPAYRSRKKSIPIANSNLEPSET